MCLIGLGLIPEKVIQWNLLKRKFKSNKMENQEMVSVVILKFEQIGQEEYKTIPYTKRFMASDRIGDILKWVKSIDPNKTLADAYFNDRN